MACPVCKAENSQGAKFCHECGIRLELQCPYCHAPSAAGAKFCSECGSNLDIRCSQCGGVNRPGAKFCQGCGVRLVTICFVCHTPTPPGARFCHECGGRLERQCAQCGTSMQYGGKFCHGCGVALAPIEISARPAAAQVGAPAGAAAPPAPYAPPEYVPPGYAPPQYVPPQGASAPPPGYQPPPVVIEHPTAAPGHPPAPGAGGPIAPAPAAPAPLVQGAAPPTSPPAAAPPAGPQPALAGAVNQAGPAVLDAPPAPLAAPPTVMAPPQPAVPAPVLESQVAPAATPPVVAPPVVAAPSAAAPVTAPPMAEAPPAVEAPSRAPPIAVQPVAEAPPVEAPAPPPVSVQPAAEAPPAVEAPPVAAPAEPPAAPPVPAAQAPPAAAAPSPAPTGASAAPPAAAPPPLSAAPPAETSPARRPPPRPAVRPAVTQKDERRLVTVLFGDVSGFTAMSEQLDPEECKLIMDNCLKLLADEVAKYEGTVDKFEGDLIMAVWGAPVAHEDDAERAVMAAMGMQTALRSFSDALQQQRGFSLKMRIGLNTGEVISGAVASGRAKDYTVMGDVVNTASRFESNAEPGTVMVGASTHALTKHMFDYEALEPIKVKGKVEPLAVYRPRGLRDVRGQRRGIEGLYSPLVGRGESLDALVSAFNGVAESHVPQLVTIAGVPGIGKSRLLDEFETYLRVQGTDFAWCKGRCLPYGQGIAFHPLAEMLKGMFGISDSDSKQDVLDRLLNGVREVMETVAGGAVASSSLDEEALEICHRLGYAMGVSYPDSSLSQITPANMKDELLWAWRRFFYYWAGASPGVIVVEDLQWGDRVVIDLLESLLDVLEEVPILVVACARPELIEQALSLVEGLNRHIIDLEPLSDQEALELLDNLLFPNLLSRAWKDRVVGAAGGIPFFLEEVLRGLVEEGRIVQSPAGWAPVQAENVPDLPVTVFATLFARMDKLPSLEKAVLQRASVVGSRFWDSALAYPATQLGREAGALLGLQAKNWVAQQDRSSFADDREYAFTNDLVRESAYKVLTKLQRVQEHRRTADWLETRVGDRTEEFIELLAYHYGQSALQAMGEAADDPGALTKAGSFGWRAAQRARNQQAYSDALAKYNDAEILFNRLRQASPDSDLRLDDLSLRELQLEVLVCRASVKEPLGQLDGALEDLNLALERAEAEALPRQAAAAYTLKGRVLRLQAQPAAAVACAERAIDLYRQVGDGGGQAQALLFLGEMYSDQAKLADFEEVCRQARALAGASGIRWLQARALTRLGSACVYQGKMAEGLDYLKEAVEINQAVSDRRGLASTSLLTGRVLQASGNSAEAIQRCEQAFAIFQELGDQPGGVAALSTLGQLYLERGNLKAARENSAKGGVLAKFLGQTAWQVRCLLLLAQTDLSEGRGQEAVDGLLEAKLLCEQSDQPAILPEVYRMLGQAYVATGDLAEAERYALLGREVVEEEDHYSQGTTWFSLALVHAALGRAAEAEAAFHHALGDLESSGEGYEIGESNLEYAQFLLRQGRREQAREHLAKARAAFADLETQDRLQRIDVLTAQLE